MSVTKKDLSQDAQIKLATYAKALGHPERIAIIWHLLISIKRYYITRVSEVEHPQPTISQLHRELKALDIIQDTIYDV